METLIVLIFKELAKPEKPIAKNCKICRKWGGCPPGRSRGPQPKAWLKAQGSEIAAPPLKMQLKPG